MFNFDFQSEDNQSEFDISIPHYMFQLNPLFIIGESNNEEVVIFSKLETPSKETYDNGNENLEDSVTKEKSKFKVTQIISKKGRKRKRKNEAYISVEVDHNKYCSDNILRKIKVHFISFIIKFINLVLLEMGFEDKFCNVNYTFKTNSNKRSIAKLKNSYIGYILNQKISPKYKMDEESNKVLYEKYKNIHVLHNIFCYRTKDFFEEFYYNKESLFNLNKFGLNINLKDKYREKLKTYNDLKDKNINDTEYITRLDTCVSNFI